MLYQKTIAVYRHAKHWVNMRDVEITGMTAAMDKREGNTE